MTTLLDMAKDLWNSKGDLSVFEKHQDAYVSADAEALKEALEKAKEELDLSWGDKVEMEQMDVFGPNDLNDTYKAYVAKNADEASEEAGIGYMFSVKTLAHKLFELKGDYTSIESSIDMIKSLSAETFHAGIVAAKEDAGWNEKVILTSGFTKDGSELSEFDKVVLSAFDSTDACFDDEDDAKSWKEDVLKVESFADALFDAEGEYDFLESWKERVENTETAVIYKNIMDVKAERGWGANITFNVYFDVPEEVYPLIAILQRVKNEMSEEEFNELFDVIKITGNVSVWGSDTWRPAIVPNGGIVIRNHHRVIAVDSDMADKVEVSSEQMTAAVKEVAEWVAENMEDDDAHYNWSLVHHADEGICWTRKAVDVSTVGQTLILVGNGLIERLQEEGGFEDNPLVSEEALEVANNSRSGVCVFRTFADVSYMHSTFRADDDYDALVEEYTMWMGEFADEEECYAELTDISYKGVRDYMTERATDASDNAFYSIEDSGQFDEELIGKLREEFISSVAGQKSSQVHSFQQYFTPNKDETATYGGVKPRYVSYLEGKESNTFIVQGNYGQHGNLDELDEDINSFVECLKNHFYDAEYKLDLNVKAPLYGMEDGVTDEELVSGLIDVDDEDFYECVNNVRQEFVEKAEEWEQDVEEMDEDEIGDFIRYEAEFNFRVIVTLDQIVDVETVDEALKELTGDLDSGCTLFVPSIGLVQGYDCGDWDTGNVNMFMKSSW